jgi:hypothetical protein
MFSRFALEGTCLTDPKGHSSQSMDESLHPMDDSTVGEFAQLVKSSLLSRAVRGNALS